VPDTAAAAAGASTACELARLRAALAVAERRLAHVQAAAGLCSWYADVDSGVVQFSPETWNVLGLDPARGPIDASTIRQHVHPDDLPPLRADRARVMSGEALVTSCFRFRGDDGVERWLESRVTRVPALPGQPSGSVGTVCDVSEAMRTRHNLERHRSQLEELVVSRTVQLAQARERAEAAGRVKSAFLSHTSHEIRTPLNVIVSLSHLMQRGVSDPAQLARVQAVEQAARHLSAIVDDLLDLARAEGSHLSLRSRPVRPASVLDEVATMLRPQASGRGLRIEVEPSDMDPAVRLHGDAARLRQALLNAGRWAVGACTGGVLRLRVQASACADARVALRLEVVLPSTDPDFDPDADPDLASLRRLSNLMAGDCGLQRQADGHSRCWFTALLDTDVDVEPRPVPVIEDVATRLRQRHAGRRVLVAEDDEVNQLVMQELLNDVGLCVDTAPDGQAALDRVADQPYALVVLDLRMPRLDGLAAARAMRTMPALHGTPIVAITANAFEEDRAACRAAGMNDFLPKPIDVERLYRRPPGAGADVDAPTARGGPGRPAHDDECDAAGGAGRAAPGAQRDGGQRHRRQRGQCRAHQRRHVLRARRDRRCRAHRAAHRGAAALAGRAGEGLQVLRYRPGAEYRPHHDYFDPAHPGTAPVLERGGQRVGTLVMYLNTPQGGGATTSPTSAWRSRRSRATRSSSATTGPHASTRTLHGGAPVLPARSGWRRSGCASGEFVTDLQPRSDQGALQRVSPCCGTRTAPAQFVDHAQAQRVGGIGLAVHDEGLRAAACRHAGAARPAVRRGRHGPRSLQVADLGAHRHVLAVDLDLGGAGHQARAAAAADLEAGEDDVVPRVGRHRLQVVQHAPAGGHAAGRDDDRG
jgi:PAS domain S-box-containing protein